MKKLITSALALTFVICLAAFSISAAETELNRAGTKWTVCRADSLFVVDDTNDYEFTWKADSTGNTYDWPVYRAESLDAGTIETTIGGIGNGGIFFGATGIKEYVGDSHEKIPGTNESKVGLGEPTKDIRYYYAAVVWEKHNNGNYKFRLYYDNAADNGTMNTYTGVALNESAHGVNGTSDVKIKVEFDKAGNLNCYVNDVRVMTRTDCQPFGDQFGIIARKSNYGSSKALTNINSVKEFSFEHADCAPTRVAEKVATCNATGVAEHYVCSCGKIYADSDGIQETTLADLTVEKDINNHANNASKIISVGNEGHKSVCSGCNGDLSEVIAHTYANGKDGACTAGCGYTKDHVCEAASHTDAKVPTCIEGGNVEYWTCECGAKYLDEACKEAAGEVELGVDPENHVIDPETAPWVSDANNHWKACTCGAELNKGAHDGLDCTICGKKTVGVYKNGEDLYYIESTGRHATGKFYVTENASNGHVTEGWYYADNTGKFIKADFFDDNGTIRYVVDGKTVYTRVTEIGGKLYMVDWDGVVLTGKFYITADSAQGLTEEGWHYTNPDGSFIVDGFFTDGEVIRYVRNGMTVYTGITKINGQFYMIDFDGEVKTDKFYVTEEATNGHVKSG
ncbi:MAG: hypothetical protein E7626_07330, partial [Ruminococcaceae bacterium]|nr:hypothetical protein [Oscillospiraceae bacterium]